MLILRDDDALTHLFCSVDDFCQAFLPVWKQAHLPAKGKRRRARSLSESEIMTLLIAFHQSGFRNFKTFYLGYVCRHLPNAFPRLVSYPRFIEFIPSVLVPLAAYLKCLLGKGTCRGISFVDSTPLAVCDNHRIKQHKVFATLAQRGKTSTGWFYGFKLHVLVNERGELLSVAITHGSVNDRKPLPSLVKEVSGLFGKVIADKGYVSQPLTDQLQVAGIELVTKPKKNMKPRSLSAVNQWLLRKRALIESVIDQLKNQAQVEHTRHRAYTGFVGNLFAALIAYCHQPKKPAVKGINVTKPRTIAEA